MVASKKELFSEYTKSLENGTAALFVGAGMSRPSGYVDWKGLMRDIAEELGLDVEQETDLVAVAQYHKNSVGNRARLDQLLIDEFTRNAKPSPNHALMSRLRVHTVWTTNYDKLIEKAFKKAKRRVDVKSRSSHLKTTMPRRDVTVYKMHGDSSHPSEAVLTKDDYERYSQSRPMFTEQLKGDLLSKTFLFLGFSFTDPNIDYILARLRMLMGEDIRNHYCVMKNPSKPKPFRGKKKASFEYEECKLRHRIDDLKRFGIQTVLIDDYDEVTAILTELTRLGHRKDLFVSGSAHEGSSFGLTRLQGLARSLGRRIIEKDYNLLSGFGLGIGSDVVSGSLEAVFKDDESRINDRLLLRPFPRRPPAGTSRKAFKTRYREELIEQAGCVVFIGGNKKAGDGTTIEADGVLEEFEIAKSMGRTPIPIGATGYAARTIWNEVMSDPARFYPGVGVKRALKVLGDESSRDQALLDAVFEIADKATRARKT